MPPLGLDEPEPRRRAIGVDGVGPEDCDEVLAGDVSGGRLGRDVRHHELVGQGSSRQHRRAVERPEHADGVILAHEPPEPRDGPLGHAAAVLHRQPDRRRREAAPALPPEEAAHHGVDVLHAQLGAADNELPGRGVAGWRQRRKHPERHRRRCRPAGVRRGPHGESHHRRQSPHAAPSDRPPHLYPPHLACSAGSIPTSDSRTISPRRTAKSSRGPSRWTRPMPITYT